MPISLDDFLARQTPELRAAIEKHAAEHIEEEASLRELRNLQEKSQQEIAGRLGIQQAAVSKLERRMDMYVSTLRDLIQALGGDLEIIARFPDKPPVRIKQFHNG
jgi:DNA-binding CsgD family transcriptional regulator